MVPFVRVLTLKPIVWDAFYSLYDNWVFDRKLAQKGSLKAGYYWFSDWVDTRLAKFILLDTKYHFEYFVETFKANRNKLIRVLIGADNEVMKATEYRSKDGPLEVFFYGRYIPLHGASYIVEAANLLKDYPVRFTMLGHGQEFSKIKALAENLNLQNIEFINPVPFEKLYYYIAACDICLGIFGEVDRMKRSVPNKVYDAASVGRAIISGDTPAMREVFTNYKDVLLCKPANAEDLAAKIVELIDNQRLRENIAQNAHTMSQNFLQPEFLVRDLLNNLHELER